MERKKRWKEKNGPENIEKKGKSASRENAELKRVEVRQGRRQGAQSRSSESECEWREMADGAGLARERLEGGSVYEAGGMCECFTSCIM